MVFLLRSSPIGGFHRCESVHHRIHASSEILYDTSNGVIETFDAFVVLLELFVVLLELFVILLDLLVVLLDLLVQTPLGKPEIDRNLCHLLRQLCHILAMFGGLGKEQGLNQFTLLDWDLAGTSPSSPTPVLHGSLDAQKILVHVVLCGIVGSVLLGLMGKHLCHGFSWKASLGQVIA